MLEWISLFPPELLQDSPQIQMLKIWGLFFSNRIDTISPLLETLEDTLDKRVLTPIRMLEGLWLLLAKFPPDQVLSG